ncbi:MAG: ABC transporter ATP-binding protein [Spirochaetes bacterium]|nr:ABC transporter ATP-binding protein [Spirochaetota bacterium]
MTNENNVLTITNLRKRFDLEAGFFARFGKFVHAVNGVSFSIGRNETYGLVGESGCGKSTTAKLLVRMFDANEGEIIFRDPVTGENVDVRKIKGQDLRHYREKVRYVFQDPAKSLNPRMTVYEVLTSGARYSTNKRPDSVLRAEAANILEEVGLSAKDLERRPTEFSGGQRQRISIARGLLQKPSVLICDEVVSALDVSIQGQILNLLLELRNARKASGQEISYLFIAHNLRVACYFCDRIGVMYRGEIMEEAEADEIWRQDSGKSHPYTELLFSSMQSGDPNAQTPKVFAGEVKSVRSQTAEKTETGCAFVHRCPYVEDRCFKENPLLKEVKPGHRIRCWLR